MTFRAFRSCAILPGFVFFLWAAVAPVPSRGQSSGSQFSNSQSGQPGASASVGYVQEKAPSLVDPAGPTISLISAEPVFVMAAALNACGYNEGLDASEPVRKRVRAEMDQALSKSEAARAVRDKLCLYIAQHRMTGTDRDIAQYISLALYLTPPPALELADDLSEMPPDATQVADVLPLLRDFAAAVDLHGIWLTVHPIYDREADEIHDPLSRMIVAANLYLKMPAATYTHERFVVVIEPQLSPRLVNARIYGSEYVVVVSPTPGGKIPMNDVRHTYLDYMIEPLLVDRTIAMTTLKPVLKAIGDAPLAYRYRSDAVALTAACLIKAIEARTMDTGIPEYKVPENADRSQMPQYMRQLQIYHQKVAAARQAAVDHDMRQGFVLTQYFYDQMIQFEKSPASLSDTIGEMVYSMDVDQQVHRARDIDFDKVADSEILMRSAPRKLTGLDLAEAQLANGDVASASELARQALDVTSDSPDAVANRARAHFILARADIFSGHPQQAYDEFQTTIATSKSPRDVSWSHIYLGRMLDLGCRRSQALAQYQLAMQTRDGQLDTRLAAERGLKRPYAVNGHSCPAEAGDNPPPAAAPEKTQPVTPQPSRPLPDAPLGVPSGASGQDGIKNPR